MLKIWQESLSRLCGGENVNKRVIDLSKIAIVPRSPAQRKAIDELLRRRMSKALKGKKGLRKFLAYLKHKHTDHYEIMDRLPR